MEYYVASKDIKEYEQLHGDSSEQVVGYWANTIWPMTNISI
jgi:hypothetical protein